MSDKVKEYIEKIIKFYELEYNVENFKIDYYYCSRISSHKYLSEDFIRKFQDNLDWDNISCCQVLSESFIREFSYKVNWSYICEYQKLSESFIREFQDKVRWYFVSSYQTLSESFIREFKDKVNWDYISCYQKLSEDFIREFKDKVNWWHITCFQKLSEPFIEEFKDKLVLDQIYVFQNLSEEFLIKNNINQKKYNLHHKETTREKKIEEIKLYAKKCNLEFDGEYLYAYRNHDEFGRGSYNKTIFYEKDKYYRDWHCDMNKDTGNSFGLGIWPIGNTKVKVSVDDWGCWVNWWDGKCRVWGFTIL